MKKVSRWLAALAAVVAAAPSCSSGNAGSAGTDAGDGLCGVAGVACCAGQSCAAGLTCEGAVCVGVADASGSSSGADAASEGSAPHDAGFDATTPGEAGNGDAGTPPSNGTGTPCSKNSDCPSGICQPVGADTGSGGSGNVCTTPCASVADCVSGWSCAPEIGQPTDVCQCQVSAPACDGLDHACSGTPSPKCTSTDPTHPAACGDGACHVPVPVATLSTTATVLAFDVTATEVVWEQTVSSATELWRASLTGGAPSLIATLPASVPTRGVLADSSYVYAGYATPANGSLTLFANAGGGPPTQNISVGTAGAQTALYTSLDGGLVPVPTMLFGDGTSVYSCAYSGSSFPLTSVLTRTASAGGTPVVLTPNCSSLGYAFDSANAYWTVSSDTPTGTTTIHATALVGGGDVTVGSTVGGGGEAVLASNGLDVLIAVAAVDAPLSVFVVPVTGGTPKDIYDAPNVANPIVLGADSLFAYLVQPTDNGSISPASVVKIPLGGGPAFTIGTGLLGSSPPYPGYIINPGALYWLETSGTSTTVWSLSL
jgi:hypothetical protein